MNHDLLSKRECVWVCEYVWRIERATCVPMIEQASLLCSCVCCDEMKSGIREEERERANAAKHPVQSDL